MSQNYNDEYEVIGTDERKNHPKYPLANTPGLELQQMSYKDWVDICTTEESESLFTDITVKDAVSIATSITAAVLGISFPVASAVSSIISVLVPYWWPASAGTPGTPSAQATWEKFMNAAEALSNKTIIASKRADALARWQGIQTLGRDYFQAQCDWLQDQNNELKKSNLRDAFDDVEDYLKVSMPFFRAQGFEIPMLAMYAQAANMHLLLLREVVQNGVSWGFQQYEIDRYYSNTDPFLGNPGLIQLLESYTDYCVQWYNNGLQQQYENNSYNWDAFNDFRRDMTIMVLDVVSLWPTYDQKRYPKPTKSQLTRTVYTDLVGFSGDFDYTQIAIDRAERELVQTPDLFTWIRKIVFNLLPGGTNFVRGRAMTFTYTDSINGYEENAGNPGEIQKIVNIPLPDTGDDVWRITNQVSPTSGALSGWIFSFIKSLDQRISWREPISSDIMLMQGLSCNGPSVDSCDLCDRNSPCRNITPNDSFPCNNKSLYSHRFSYLGAGLKSDLTTLTFFSYGWTHVSADANNLIDTKKITQIPAVKGSHLIGNARVIKGTGSTGGDLVVLPIDSQVFVNVTTLESDTTIGYEIRIRYASATEVLLNVRIEQPDSPAIYRDVTLPATTSHSNLTYAAFNYYTIAKIGTVGATPGLTVLRLSNSINELGAIIDKIEFIPSEWSLEEYQTTQDLEEARKAVNALFMNDAKNALQLDVTDYAVDQAANLVECVSEDFHAQEKMILLDQVKFAKRLSQTRNLLNYGDFESSDWSGENGWRTSNHVHVASDNPIFKGRYLHMPGAMSPQFSNNIYPTYAYQKVDESKLKSYTRYLVRGFVGNSKDLELLVERYGKEVHVEMDVPNDIQYSLPMNECGGFNRCKPASYQTRPPHTCTCKDTAVAHTDCQCKDKVNRTSADVYTNESTSRGMYADEFHSHKSCGCGDKHMDKNGTHPHKSCGCKNSHVFTYHIDTGCVDMVENVGLFFALKIASENGIANIDNLEIIEAQPLTGEALARVKKREQRWKQERDQKRVETEKAVQAAQTAVQNLFTNAQQNRLKFETLFPQIVHAEALIQQIRYVYHPFLQGALPAIPGMNFDLVQELSMRIENARMLFETRNLIQNGSFSAGTGSWHVTDGVEVQPLQNTSVLVLSEWSHEASQQVRIDSDRGYVLRVTARKEGAGKGTVTLSDCADYMETLTFTSCDYNKVGSQTMTEGTLTGFVTKTLEIFPDTDQIRIDIGETEGTFKVESVELICMEQMEDHLYDRAGSVAKFSKRS
ncbi:insecticidal delta-endotoxin Cry8Ea1 family protein [Bacillus cereus]|uniref:insecticidal delta-endotoxin Cry8Ea1 family protein n=1 Tax=Bacillus cereus TaxID=1396 RepID=UPI000BFE166E|nr:insecticidal delta-endotoxin Cry8Ea1 family protein [Bacillus cereus]PGQ06354.1 hypothetical protein COA09_25645 [Bacillus cereus]PGS51201.1 hypothetical protein COC67_25690 [Bacillus cereus]PGV16592.1 hypothetical protein COD77_06960 [Bacillus cereus]